MYLLKEYYLNKGEICEHIVTTSKTIEGINKEKDNISKILNECDITAYEIMFTKNINNVKTILHRDNIKVFRVISI